VPDTTTTTDVLVVVPAYNEALLVADVVRDLLTSFPHVLVVDDGSTDATASLAASSGAVVARHSVNLGQGAALKTGLTYAQRLPGVEYVITFDADGQHRVEDAVAMLRTCRDEGLDVVLGSRGLGSVVDQPARRRLLLRGALVLGKWSSGLALTDTHNGLRVLSIRAVRTIRLTQCRMAYASELEKQVGIHDLRWREAPVQVHYTDYSRRKGQGDLNAVNIVFDLLAARLRST
jgi:glycosyltransferase involved in cell wall biosynthesis